MSRALLIDGEGIPSATATAILGLVPEAYAFRRVYGDMRNLDGWTGVSWASVRHVAAGRAGTDFAIIIDAVTLAYGKGCRSFMLVTAGSDFRAVVDHLREHGCTVTVLHVPAADPATVVVRSPRPAAPDPLQPGRVPLRVVPGLGRKEDAVRPWPAPQTCDPLRSRLRLVETGPVPGADPVPELAGAQDLDGTDRVRLKA
jgi:hypothetical protein